MHYCDVPAGFSASHSFHDVLLQAVYVGKTFRNRVYTVYGQHTIAHADRLSGGLKLADFHLLFLPVQPEADTPPDPASEAPAQLADMPEPVCSEAGIGNDGDGFIFRDSLPEAVKETALNVAVLRQFSGNNLTHQRK